MPLAPRQWWKTRQLEQEYGRWINHRWNAALFAAIGMPDALLLLRLFVPDLFLARLLLLDAASLPACRVGGHGLGRHQRRHHGHGEDQSPLHTGKVTTSKMNSN
ncbi:MAG: hypothetical protein LOX97_07930 [Sphingomonas sp.]|nr:hypothetical protein [Sphingomonas sp.]